MMIMRIKIMIMMAINDDNDGDDDNADDNDDQDDGDDDGQLCGD